MKKWVGKFTEPGQDGSHIEQQIDLVFTSKQCYVNGLGDPCVLIGMCVNFFTSLP